MKKLRDTNLGRYLVAISATVHPVRAIFEVCGTLLFAVPFLAAFVMTRSAPLYLYLLYPLLFLVSHFVWFRLPFVERRLRWLLFWSTVALVAALGAAFMYWSYREAGARGSDFPVQGIFAIPHWVAPNIDADFPPPPCISWSPRPRGPPCTASLFALFLRLYQRYRAEEHRRRPPPDAKEVTSRYPVRRRSSSCTCAAAAAALVLFLRDLHAQRSPSLFFLRTPEVLFSLTAVFFLFTYIYATNANMDYVQRFMTSHGNLRLAPNSTLERLAAWLRFLPLLAVRRRLVRRCPAARQR